MFLWQSLRPAALVAAARIAKSPTEKPNTRPPETAVKKRPAATAVALQTAQGRKS